MYESNNEGDGGDPLPDDKDDDNGDNDAGKKFNVVMMITKVMRMMAVILFLMMTMKMTMTVTKMIKWRSCDSLPARRLRVDKLPHHPPVEDTSQKIFQKRMTRLNLEVSSR